MDELALLVAALPERLRLMIELAAWCALRYGEVAELRRGDIDLRNGVIRITRAVQWVDGVKIVAAPKADSVRLVAFPPHLGDAIKNHLKNHALWGSDGLLFPTTTASSTEPPRSTRRTSGRPGKPPAAPTPLPRPPPHRSHARGCVRRDAR